MDTPDGHHRAELAPHWGGSPAIGHAHAVQRSLMTACTAVYGVAVGISTYPLWIRPAPPGQLPGFMKNIMNLEAHASLHFFASIVILALCSVVALRPAVNRLLHRDSQPWPRYVAVAALIEPLWYVSLSRDVAWTALPTAIVVAACVYLRCRDLRISSHDTVLLPTFGAVFIALADLTALPLQHLAVLSLTIVMALRAALGVIGRNDRLQPGLCFALSPLALILQSHLLARADRRAGWPALVIALVSPLILRLTLSDSRLTRRRIAAFIALVAYPVAALSYTSAAGVLSAESRPRVDFFEDAQHLTPAATILKSALPYRDVIPPHGLIQDGLLDAAILLRGSQSIGNVLRTRATLFLLMSVAIYALAIAATGSANLAFVAFLAATGAGDMSGEMRFLPSVAALALAAFAARYRSRKLLAVAGAASVVAALTSIDFGLYAAVATVAAAALVGISWRERARSISTAAFGAVCVLVPSFAAMAVAGFLADFFRVTAYELRTLSAVYAEMPFNPPNGFDTAIPRLLVTLFDSGNLPYFVWTGCLIALITFVAERFQSPNVPRRAVRPLIVIASWIVAAGASYVERQHIYFRWAIMPLLAGVLLLLFHRSAALRRPMAVAMIAVMALLVVNPTWHLAVVGSFRRAPGPIEPGWREVGLPRAQGAYFRDRDAALIDTVNRYAQAHLGPGDTFFDFTNHGLLYFLLDRDLPVRQIEVAFYETDDLQREVIDRIRRNPRIRFALVPSSDVSASGIVDAVANRDRAPLVWRYLQEHFEPDFAESGIELWRRK
jgi:hypothetical protein